jgi:Spy/CpxP family protein refolding chaperone
MRHIAVVVVVAAVLVGSMPAWAFHEEYGRAVGEYGRVFDQVVDQFRGLAGNLEKHLGGISGVTGSMGPESVAPSAAERPVISLMLEHRDELGLTPDQASRLETLRQTFSRDAVRRDADIRIAEMDLAGLLDKEPLDLAKVETKIKELAQLRAELRIARLRAIEQGKAVLTAEQRTKLQALIGTPSRAAGRGPATRL